MINLVEQKRGRGIPKDKHKIIRTAWRKSDSDDMNCYHTIEKVADTRKVKKNNLVKNFLKNRIDDIEREAT